MDLARYAELFRTESREHLGMIDAALVRLAECTEERRLATAVDVAASDGERGAINDVFRSMHTIKGMAAAMGYVHVEHVAHASETLLAHVRDGARATDGALIALLQEAADTLGTLVDGLAGPSHEAEQAPAAEGTAGATSPTALFVAALCARLDAQSDESDGAESPAADALLSAAALLAAAEAKPLPTASAPAAESSQRQVRIDLSRLDTLLNLVAELVIVRDQLLAVAENSGDRSLRAAVADTSRLVSAMQWEVLEARMVPMSHVFDRFPRVVRELSRELGRHVDFVMEGRELAVDRSMVDAVSEPIMHLLRNAIDHGLELPEDRVRAGKSAAGRLVLRASRDRAQLVIAVEDDGRGIDRGRVLRRAHASGLLAATVDALSEERLLTVLSQPGFSTADQVTSVSGRGVGIDVVATRARELGGALQLTTTTGLGSTFELRLPVSLAIVRALLVRVGAHEYAIPSAHVVEAAECELEAAGDRTDSQERQMVRIRDHAIPLVRLQERFGAPVGSDTMAQLVVVEHAGRRAAWQVDALLGQRDIVVKPILPIRGAPGYFSGATVLGDGKPALIVDVGSLV